MTADNLSDLSIHELFRLEVDQQAPLLIEALLALEADTLPADQLKTCMRCAHSLKGAARMVSLSAAVCVAHAMEECLVDAQQGRIKILRRHIDALLQGVDLLKRVAYTPAASIGQWNDGEAPAVLEYLGTLRQAIKNAEPAAEPGSTPMPQVSRLTPSDPAPAASHSTIQPTEDRMLRVTAENLNRMLGLAGESLVASRWLKPFADQLLQLKRMQAHALQSIERLDSVLSGQAPDDGVIAAMGDVKQCVGAIQPYLTQRLAELEDFARRESGLAQRLYDQALASRMRPFSDGVRSFPRMVRDLSHALEKAVILTIEGQSTQVDRDILEKLEAPLTHLLRNAIDHGIESPAQRQASGKPAEARIRLEAGHRAGMLIITVADDGQGIALEPLRTRIVARGLTSAETAQRLSEAELLEFLFLPGFTMKDEVSELSGRSVGLDIVQHMVKQVRGSVRIETEEGQGTRFRLQLPLTTSVVRALTVEVDGQPYAFPLAWITRTLILPADQIEQLEGHQHFCHNGQRIGLVTAHQVLRAGSASLADELPVVILGEGARQYGVIVDRLTGEHELVVQALDSRLGKIRDIAAGALMEDGTPVLIIDVDDMMLSIDKLIVAGPLHRAQGKGYAPDAQKRKRVLLVDDSLTVRELERKLLLNAGYEVEVAVDGMDGWNAARTGAFNLVITDIDMPRMDGIELVTLLKQHPQLQSVPVLIVSYKDREEDRQRGLSAGADYYLTKSSFHDERMLGAVVDLIGEANE